MKIYHFLECFQIPYPDIVMLGRGFLQVVLDKTYQEEVEEFRRRVIYEKMREEEEASNVFAGWLQGLDGLAGPDFEYLK